MAATTESEGDEERFRAAGMDGYVSKPFDLDHLVESITDLAYREAPGPTESTA